MAREKKLTIKHFENQRIKPDLLSENHPLYMRLRYDNVQVDLRSYVPDFAAIELGFSDKIDWDLDLEDLLKVKKYLIDSSVKQELIDSEKELITLIFNHYLSSNINILKGETRYYLEYNLATVSSIIKRSEGKRLFYTIQEKGYSDLYHILKKEDIDILIIGLKSISNNEFDQVLSEFQPSIEILNYLSKEQLSGNIIRSIHWKTQINSIRERIEDSQKDSKLKIEIIDSAIQFNEDNLKSNTDIYS
jgi:hypothetical protein